MKHRKGRVEGEILRELTKIIRKNIRDPRVSDVTFTAVACSNDFSYATVYYSLLGQSLTMYKVPELIFKRDQSVIYGSKIDRLLADLKKQEQDRQN